MTAQIISLAKTSARFSKDSEIAKIVKDHEEWEAKKRARFAKIKHHAKLILEDMLPQGFRFSCDAYGMTIYVPWSKGNLAQTRKACGAGWTFRSQYKDDSGTLSRHYIYDGDYDVSLTIILDSQKLVEGACRRILVEEKVEAYTQTRKVYKVICDDGTESYETVDVEAEEGKELLFMEPEE